MFASMFSNIFTSLFALITHWVPQLEGSWHEYACEPEFKYSQIDLWMLELDSMKLSYLLTGLSSQIDLWILELDSMKLSYLLTCSSSTLLTNDSLE